MISLSVTCVIIGMPCRHIGLQINYLQFDSSQKVNHIKTLIKKKSYISSPIRFVFNQKLYLETNFAQSSSQPSTSSVLRACSLSGCVDSALHTCTSGHFPSTRLCTGTDVTTSVNYGFNYLEEYFSVLMHVLYIL